MNVEDVEWVSHALMDYERKRCISKVLSIDCKDAIAKGNNYASDMLRLSMKVVLHSGEVLDRSVIYKAMPVTEVRKNFIKGLNVHRVESAMLNEIWPEVERIRQEKELGVERISPICYSVKKGHDGYLLEDLNKIGYKMADRRKLLDFHHGKLVMNAYAQLHAASLVLIERGDLVTSNFSENYFYNNPGQIEALIMPTLTSLAADLEDKWEPEWACYGEKVRAFSKGLSQRVTEELRFNENNFNALNHGDCWLTNMMFRHDSDGLPQSVRLLDFQLSNYNNVGQDLQYFLNSSLNAEARKRKLELVRLYHEKLVSALSLYGYSGEAPTWERVLDCYNRVSVFGLSIGLGFVPFVMQPPEDVPEDLEEWAKEYVAQGGMKAPSLDSQDLRDVLKVVLKEGTSSGLL